MMFARKWLSRLRPASAWSQIGDNDPHEALERLYTQPDPWAMVSPREQFRFDQTNQLISTLLPRRARHVLEIGCGEGHQSLRLAEVADTVFGLDVSETAVQRARIRMPAAHFARGSAANLPFSPPEGGRFDLVTACEVLYYMSDPALAVREMSALGQACFVSFYAPRAAIVSPALSSVAGVQTGWFAHEDTVWLWAYWQRPPAPESARPDAALQDRAA